jgi:hypothetical protein
MIEEIPQITYSVYATTSEEYTVRRTNPLSVRTALTRLKTLKSRRLMMTRQARRTTSQLKIGVVTTMKLPK